MTKVELYKSRIFVTIIHLCALGQFAYGLYYSNFEVQRSYKLKTSFSRRMVPETFPQKVRFISYWSLIIQALYYIVSLINDFVGTNELLPKRAPAVRRFKDWLLATLAFPVALNVSITFWVTYYIDRELVFPKVLDAVFPSWLNHVLHTNIVVFIVLEMFTSYRAYPTRSKGLSVVSTFCASYIVWVHIIKHYSNVWVYPLLGAFSLPGRLVFFAAMIGFSCGLYMLGEFINNVVWAKEVKLSQRKSK